MQIFAEAGTYQPPPSGEPNDWIVHLSTSDLSLGTYSIPAGGADDQQPHTEDEIYVVKTGRATMVTPSGTAAVGPGSVIYVPAGEEHRFTDVTEDLALIVVFAPPYGSRALPGPCLPGCCLPGLGDARRLLDAAPCQRVGALVTGIARVPLHPHPGDFVRAHRLGQPAP
jgi:mannose-6-phosphate isomerase-like protein (cupin superfamily)